MHSLSMSMNETCTVSTHVEHWAKTILYMITCSWRLISVTCRVILQLNPISFMDVFVIKLGWQLSLTPREGDHYLMSKLMVMASKESDYFLQTYVLQFACWNPSLVVVWCVCLFDACHRLTNSLVEEGKCFIQRGVMGKVGGPRGRTVSFICEPEHLCLSKGTLSFNC